MVAGVTQVSDIMTRDVVSIAPDEMIDTAIDLMLSRQISGLPVIDGDGKLVGILTEGDLLRRPELGAQHARSSWRDAFLGMRGAVQKYVHSHGVRVKDVMTRDPVVVAEDTSLDEVARLMETRAIKRLPVTRNGEVIAIVSRASLMRALVEAHRKANLAPTNDKAIRQRILDDIAPQDWAAGVVVDVAVHHGAADLWGSVLEEAQAKALKALVEGTPGVQRVEHYLTCDGEVVALK
jgi:CBS domain-containing protein